MSSWSEFLRDVSSAKRELGNPDTVWYRGHTNTEYYLLSSLLRYENGTDKEQYLFDTFKKFSNRIFDRRKSDWETLFEMQHYGVPTRLLDWTETFGIALFFACGPYYRDGVDAALYLLNPVELNRQSRVDRLYRIPDDEKEFIYKEIYWHNRPFAPRAPISVEPHFINDRMKAQRGMFTVDDDSIDPIEENFPSAVKKITLPSDAIPEAREFLSLANLNPLTVYPDQAGLADYLRDNSELIKRWS